MATLLYSYPNKLFALYSNPGWSILPNNYKNDWDFNNPSSALNFNIAASVNRSKSGKHADNRFKKNALFEI